jgi:arylsulfatase A-like enzyme/Flp pilus assembly protein TadD
MLRMVSSRSMGVFRLRAMGRILVVAALFGLSCGRRDSEPRVFRDAPVILISVDTLRADHLPAYGYGGVATPNLDEFHRQATLFRNAYAPTPLTLPSHLTMLTGLLPPEHGVRDNVGFRFDAKAHPTIGSILHHAGYATGATVSSYVLRGETGLAEAFDFYQDSIEPPPGARFRDYQRPGMVTEGLAEKWIDQQKGRPFFLFFHIYEPHVPYDPPEPFRTRYAANPYDGEIATADAIIGSLLQHLRNGGIYDRALIIFASDHGEGLGDHGEQQHSVLIYREAIHVPLMIKLPRGARAGTEIREPVSLADLLPTVTALLGISAGTRTSGLPLFAGLPSNRAIYSESLYARLHFGWSELRSLTDVSRQFIDSPRPELFDIVNDVAEKRDLAPSNRRDVAAYRNQLARLPAAEAIPSRIGPDEKARLSALGYVAAPAASTSLAVNPADRIGEIEELQHASRLAFLGDPTASRAAFRSLLAKNPQMVEGWIHLGDVLYRSGQFGEAIAAYRNALARSPRPSSDLLISLGSAYLQTGDFTRAAECGEAALAITPHEARVLLVQTALMRGDLTSAARELKAIERLTSSDLVLAAEIEQRQAQYESALALLDKAQNLARNNSEGSVYRLEFLRADTYARMNRLQEATASFEKEIAAFPGEIAAYTRLAVVRAVADDRRGAAEVLDRMLRANPTPAARRAAADTRRTLSN